MAEVTPATGLQKQVWMKKYFQEYVRLSSYLPYMTNADMNKGGIILSRYELQQESGKTINVPFIGRLKSLGVTGTEVLDGNEEGLTNFNCPISIDWRRNGVRIPKSTSYQVEVDLWNAARDALITWEAEKVRDDITNALGQVIVDTNGTTVNIGSSTSTQRNFWTAANPDRILFGSNISDYSATFATGLGNITSGMTASAAMFSKAKRIAKLADPHIRPMRTAIGREFFVAFHGSRSFRDIKSDSTIIAANTNARPREDDGMKENPLFQDGDILYDGVIHHEVPELDAWADSTGIFDGQGSGGVDIRPVFLCGGGAVAIAWGQEPTPRTDLLKDYQFRPGVAIEELLGVKKVNFNGIQNGIVTVLVCASADS